MRSRRAGAILLGRSRRASAILLGVGALVIAGCGSGSNASSSHPATAKTTSPASSNRDPNGGLGPEGIPLETGPVLASPSTTTQGATVDGIECAPVEQLAYHIHAHLQVYVDGRPRSLPGAIGLMGPVAQQTPYGTFYGATQCYYWLHTHASDGVIHIESPTQRIYTLGNFFDEWHQPLSADHVASAKGTVAAFINGRRWTRGPRALPLEPHAVIQLDVGSPVVPFSTISWAGTNL